MMSEAKTEAFKALANFINSDETKPDPAKLDNLKLWDLLIDVAQSDTKNLELYFQVFEQYVEKVPEFRHTDVPRLTTIINTSANASLSTEERSKAFVPLIITIPFTTIENATAIIKAGIDICDALIKEKNEIPSAFLDNFDDVLLDSLDSDYLPDFVKVYLDALESDKFVAAAFCIAPILNDLCELLPDHLPKLLEYLNTALKGDLLKKVAGCRLLDYLCDYFENDMEACPEIDGLLSAVTPILNESNISFVKCAYHALYAMVACHVFPMDDLTKLFAILESCKTDAAIKYFFKLLRVVLTPDDDDCGCDDECCEHHHHEDEVDMKTIQQLLDFSLEHMKGNYSPLIKAHSIDFLSDIASKDQAYIEDSYNDALGVVAELISSNSFIALPWITSFHIVCQEYFPQQTKQQVKTIISTVMANYNNEAIPSMKERNMMFTDVCRLIGSGGSDEHIAPATEHIFELLKNSDIKFVGHGCAAVLCLLDKINLENAIQIFGLVSERAKIVEDSEDLNMLMHTLNDMLEKSIVSMPAEKVEPFVQNIMKGELKILKGCAPVDLLPPDGSYFVFLSTFIKKYPLQAASVCQTLIEWLEKDVSGSISLVLEPISTGIEVFAIKEEGAKKLVNIIKGHMDDVGESEFGELETILDCLAAINTTYPSTLKPADQFFPPLKKAVQLIASADEEEDFQLEGIEIMPTVAKFVFSVYANNSDVEVDEDLLGALVSMMPFSPEIEFIGDLITYLVDMLDDQERFESIVVPTLKMFAELLLLKKSELEEFQFDDDVVKAMKNTLKTICKKKPAIAKQISKDYQSSRAKLNRFNTLIR